MFCNREIRGHVASEALFLREKIAYPLKAHFYHAVKAALGKARTVTPDIRERASGFVDLDILRHNLSWILNINDTKPLTLTARAVLDEALKAAPKTLISPHDFCIQTANATFSALELRYTGRRIEDLCKPAAASQRAMST